MKKSLLVVLITLVLPTLSIQDKEGRGKKGKNGTGCILNPRTFNGRRVSAEPSDSNCSNSVIGGSKNTSKLPELELPHRYAEEYLTGLVSTRLLPIAYLLAIAVGVPANAYILACLGGRAGTCSGAALYLSLAMSDLLLLVTLAFRAHYHFKGNDWEFGEAACRLVMAFFHGNIYCSVQALMCVSIMRYLAVARPFLYKALPKRACAILATVIIWLACAVAMAPELLVRHTYRLPRLGVTTCHDVLPYAEEPYTFLAPYRLGLALVGLALPASVVAFSYGSVVSHLGRSSRDWSVFVHASTLVFVIFAVCFTPLAVLRGLHYTKLLSTSQDHFYVYHGVAVCLCCYHSCLDPFLSYILSRTTNSNPRVGSFREKPTSGVSAYV